MIGITCQVAPATKRPYRVWVTHGLSTQYVSCHSTFEKATAKARELAERMKLTVAV